MLLQNIKQKKQINLSELTNSELLKLILNFFDNKRYEDVIKISNKIKLKSVDQYWVYYLRGLSYFKLNNYDDAIDDFNLSLVISPNSPSCYLQLGMAFHQKKNFENAEKHYKLAISSKQNYVDAIANLGKLYKDFGYYKKAEANLNKAIQINPNFAPAYNNLGALAEAQDDLINAKKHFYKSIFLDKSYHHSRYNLSLIQLYENSFKEGWNNFEDRWKNIYYQERKLHTDQPIWSPKVNIDCHVTIWPEQGMGDFILYSRFFGDLIKVTDRITVFIAKKLLPLYERTFPQIKFVTELDTSLIEYHAPIGDLAKFFVNSTKDVKARSDCYLTVDKRRSEKIKQSLPKGKMICGISWISKNDSIGKNKSMTLEDLKDLLLLPDITFIDLQYTDTSEERADFKDKYGVDILKLEEIDNFNDIDGLASLIDACDKVVSVSNTTAHIAGSIGKETCLMLPKGKGRLWYWSKEDQQSVWYKSIKIIEQTEFGCWRSVIEKIKNEFLGVI